MYGAIIGDVVGSRHEFSNTLSKDFSFLTKDCYFTDDTVMTVAVADALMKCEGSFENLSDVTVERMQKIGRLYPNCGYGGRFIHWMFTENPQPYHSYGNGSAMRVSAVAWVAETLDECIDLARKVTVISHDHPEGIKGAEATAVAIWMARHGASKEEILKKIKQDYYDIDFTIDERRVGYVHSEACMYTVPEAIEAFMESENFEDCIRIAISLGGDSDTIAAIAGSIAEAYYGISETLVERVKRFLSLNFVAIIDEFERLYGNNTWE